MPSPEELTAATLVAEPGSFRDPESRVVLGDDGDVFRFLSRQGVADWRRLAGSELWARRVADGSLIASQEVPDDRAAKQSGLLRTGAPAAVLQHERVPFVSYAYEWTFSMLKDAAQLQLDLELEALDEGMTLKDATPYNVQWRGSEPVFIDVGSFEQLREDEPWIGYRQFCMLNLYPLMLQAFKGIDFQRLLRGSLEGIAPTDCARLLSRFDRLRRGVFTHVYLHARLERRYRRASGAEVTGELRRARFNPELIRSNVKGLKRLVSGLDWQPEDSAWSDYRQTSMYTAADTALKQAFVRRAAAGRERSLTWDLGCNDGAYARIAAEHSLAVIAIDSDHGTVEALYRSLREERQTRILPLVADLADPPPGLGWRGLERMPLGLRGTPDLVLCLAFIHHMTIGSNVPVREFLRWLADLEAEVVIEFPERDDPMVRRLLAAKRKGSNPDYEREHFERCLHEAFQVTETARLPSGTRSLYSVAPRR